MATISANITGNIGIKTGNFSLAVALFEVATGFSAANVMIGGSSSGVTFTVTGEGKDYHVNITLPLDTDLSSFTVGLTGNVMVSGSSEDIFAIQKVVNYDTQSTISAVLGDPEYTEFEENLLIKVPVAFASEEVGHTSIVGLDKTDFGLHRLLGDEIFDFDYYITGSDLEYQLNIIPSMEKYGAFSVDIVGHVLKADGITNEVVLNHAIILYYDTRTPNLVDFDMPDKITSGIVDIYLEFDLNSTGLSVDDFIYEGFEFPYAPVIYRWDDSDNIPVYKKSVSSVGSDRASAAHSLAYDSESIGYDPDSLDTQAFSNEVGNWKRLTTTSGEPPNENEISSLQNPDFNQDGNTVESKYFLLRFLNDSDDEGVFNIRLREGAVKGPSGEPVDSLQQQSGIQQRSSRAVVRQTQTLTVTDVYWLGSNNQGPSNFLAIDFNVGTATPSINDMTFSGEVYLDGVLQDTLNSDDVVGLFQVANGFAIRFNLPDFDYFFVRLQIDAGVIEPDSASVLPHAAIDVTLTDGSGTPPDPVDPIDPVDPLDEIIPTISIADSQIERGELTTATITFPSAHTGFTIDDLSVDFGSISNFIIVDALTYTVDITAPTFSIGDITLRLSANALTGNTNPEVTATVSWVAAAFGANWIVPTSPVGLMFTSELRFVVPVSGFILNDIRLRSEDAVAFVLSGQNATITPIAGTNNYLISIDASSEITGSALYSFRLRARSVTYDGLAYPAATIDSPEFTIDDTIGQIATFTITTPTATAISGVPIVFSIASNIGVNGLTDADITVVGGVAEPIQGSGSAYTVRVTPPSTGSGSITLTIAENAVDELNNETSLSINYSSAVVAEAVVISQAAEQNVVIDTDYELTLTVTGNPDRAYVRGDWDDDFYHKWNDPELKIIGRAKKLLAGRLWTAVAVKDEVDFTRDIIYNVVDSAPVIGRIGSRTIVRGIQNVILIPIAGKSRVSQVFGPLLKMGFTISLSNNQLALVGTPPADIEFDISEGIASISVSNDSGSDSYDFPFNFTNEVPTTNEVPGVPINVTGIGGNGQITLTFNEPSINASAITHYEYTVYIDPAFIPEPPLGWTNVQPTLNLDGTLSVVIPNLNNGQVHHTFIRAVNAIGAGEYSGAGFVMTFGRPLYLSGRYSTISAVSHDFPHDAYREMGISDDVSISLDSGVLASVVGDEDNIYVRSYETSATESDEVIYVISKIGDNPRIPEREIPIGLLETFAKGMAISVDELCLCHIINMPGGVKIARISFFDKNTQDGVIPTINRSFDFRMRTSQSTPPFNQDLFYGIAIDGNNLYIVRRWTGTLSSDLVRMDLNTANDTEATGTTIIPSFGPSNTVIGDIDIYEGELFYTWSSTGSDYVVSARNIDTNIIRSLRPQLTGGSHAEGAWVERGEI